MAGTLTVPSLQGFILDLVLVPILHCLSDLLSGADKIGSIVRVHGFRWSSTIHKSSKTLMTPMSSAGHRIVTFLMTPMSSAGHRIVTFLFHP